MIKEQIKGYVDFIRTQGIAGFAIGFILGKAVSDLVGSFVNDIINPLIGLIFKNFDDLSKAHLEISGAIINYGRFISLLINFLILAAVVYFGIKKISQIFDKPKDSVK